MQNTSGIFKTLATSNLRPIKTWVGISFDKSYDPNVGFFEIGTSEIGSNDIIRGVNVNDVQNWDKYYYYDLSSRVLSVNTQRTEDIKGSITNAITDVVFDNTDNYFTTGISPISEKLIPKRPIRVQIGFGNEVVQTFIGITNKTFEVDYKNGTATITGIDYLSTILDIVLTDTIDMPATRSDLAIIALLELGNILEAQMHIEEGNITFDFYAEEGTTVRENLEKIVEMEQGRLFMDEKGTITFKNRDSYDTEPVWDLDYNEDVLDYQNRREDDIINTVLIDNELGLTGSYVDSASVEKYDTQSYEIQNNFFPDQNTIDVVARIIVETYKEYGTALEVTSKGLPFLQIGDTIRLRLSDLVWNNYKITGMVNRVMNPCKYIQVIRLKNYNPFSWFTIGVSKIGGVDLLRYYL